MESTNIIIYRHIVVVENDQQIIGIVRGVVESLERKTATYRRVADHGNGLPVFLSRSIKIGDGHPERRRYGVTRMPAYKRVVFALRRKREAADASFGPLGGEAVSSACQDLMGICLMAYIPDYAVARCIENIMESHNDFNCSHARSEMPRIVRKVLNQKFSDFSA